MEPHGASFSKDTSLPSRPSVGFPYLSGVGHRDGDAVLLWMIVSPVSVVWSFQIPKP